MAVRFWEKVQKDDVNDRGCWRWTGAHGEFGHGHLSICRNGEQWLVQAHRVSYWLNVGDIPFGLWVCHHCDNPWCVNPRHLFIGTRSDNMRDCARKGRTAAQARPECMPRGESHGMVELTEKQVRDIRAAYASGATQVQLARRYKVGQPHISSIVLRKVWRHVA
jgi:hypothetical protein